MQRRRGGSPRPSRSKFDYVGVLAVEMFVLRGGAEILVNEIAPRVHNSGHWTLDGASVSQFEQHIRAVAGWPLAKPMRRGRVEMTNLIGSEVDDFQRWLAVPGAAGPSLRQGRRPARAARWATSPASLPTDGRETRRYWWTFRGRSATCRRKLAVAFIAMPPIHFMNPLQEEHACRFSSVTTMSTRPLRR